MSLVINASSALTPGAGLPGGLDTQVQYNNAGAFGGITGVISNGSSMTFNDDVSLRFGTGGTASLLFETADGNANALLLAFPEGGAVDVPVFIVADVTAVNKNLGLFDGITNPTIATLSDDATKAMMMWHTDSYGFLGSTAGIIITDDKLVIGRTTPAYSDNIFEAHYTHTKNTGTQSFVAKMILNSAASSAAEFTGWYVDITPDGSGAGINYTGTIQGMLGYISTSNARTINNLIGVKQQANNSGSLVSNLSGGYYTTTMTSGTSTNMIGGYFLNAVTDGTTSAIYAGDFNNQILAGTHSVVGGLYVANDLSGGTFDTAYGIVIPAYTGFVDPTISYGIYVESPGLGTTQWTIASVGGNNYFSGSVSIGKNTAPTANVDVAGDVLITQDAQTGTVQPGFKYVGGAHTSLTASTEYIDIYIDESSNLTFATGNMDVVTFNYFNVSHTISFAGASQVDYYVGAVFELNIKKGVNTTIIDQYGVDFFMDSANGSNYNTTMSISVPATSFGIGAQALSTGLLVWSYGENISLGNQTATLNNLNGIRIEGITYTSDTNVRTVTNAVSLYIEPPTAGTNVIFTNGAYAAHLAGNTLIEQNAQTGTVNPGFTYIGGAHTSLTASTPYTDFYVDSTQTLTFATGNIDDLAVADFELRPTITFAGASTVSYIMGAYFDCGVKVGTFATFTNQYGVVFDASGLAASNYNIAIEIIQPSNSAVVGSQTSLSALLISNEGEAVSLGAQTATTTNLNSIRIEGIEYESTTNVRTITYPTALYVQSQTAGANVTFSNPALAAQFVGDVKFDQEILNYQATQAAANDMTFTSNVSTISGATQMNRIAAPAYDSSHSARLVLIFASNPVVKHNQAAGGGYYPILLSGSGDFNTAANTVLELIWDAANSVWQEIARKTA